MTEAEVVVKTAGLVMPADRWGVNPRRMRRGGAQALADAGMDPTGQGRWKPGSAVVKREYLDRASSRTKNPWLKLARPELEA